MQSKPVSNVPLQSLLLWSVLYPSNRNQTNMHTQTHEREFIPSEKDVILFTISFQQTLIFL